MQSTSKHRSHVSALKRSKIAYVKAGAMHIKPETHKICVRCSGLKALKLIGMVSQQFATLTAAFTVHFAELNGMENQYEHLKFYRN